ncbi:bifunctional oligoribonuclease/PAP phosphatase NrnA [Paenibacillus sp. J5C_2022]|uniref:DHH family phosphoesterase n=1 Tax=Paenibacillus sp. J5C2022 TaxID=2977129 RepID=UPI0021D0FF95|nr:bifunctional oligoribonuclease/PAP phosphatase NrnA [Paenibacillus sp. J5C2022]MCU6707149.1 bifunctional oligoribonuclease/PAP phosphatase NrnA [Paenibacillus sp. J5C2022]
MSGALSYSKQLDEALDFIKDNASFLVVSHVQPDGDAISSTSVMSWLLQQMGKRAVLVNESELPGRLSYLYHYDLIRVYRDEQVEWPAFDAVIALDCADFRRIGLPSRLFPEGCPLLNIDHHPTNNDYGTVNIVKPDAAATVEILYDLLLQAGYSPDLDCANAIYTGLLTDTGGFRYSNTSPKVMEIAAKLLAVGVSGSELADHLLEKMTMAGLKLLQLSLSRLMFSDNGEIGWLYIRKDDLKQCGAVSEDMEGIVNYALNVDGVEIGILFKETDDGGVKASLRSAGKADVAVIAKQFGGGGHVRASGCRIEQPLEDAMAELVEAARKALM